MKVLLPVEYSDASQNVIAEAVSRPWPSGTLFCVQNTLNIWEYDDFPELLQDAKKEMQKVVASATYELRSTGHEVITELEAGVPKKAIPEYAKQWGADLIMVGSRRSNAVSRFLVGSVAQAVLRAASCSVEIVRSESPGFPKPTSGMKILIGTDGSCFSERAIRDVVKRPWPPESVAKIISVRENVVPSNESTVAFGPLYPADLMDQIVEDELHRAENAYAQALEILSSSALKICESPVLFGDPRPLILDEAKSWGAHLVVLGSHGRRGFDHLLLGSVSEAVAMHAHCSVEVVRSSKDEKPESRS